MLSRIKYLSALCVVFIFAGTGLAQASPIDKDLQIAYAGLPTNPCVGKVVVTWQANLTGTNDGGVIVPADGLATGISFYPDGSIILNSCDITVNIALVEELPERLCDVIVHEVWHLAGVRHTYNDGSVMDASGAGSYPPCHPKLTKRQEVQRLITSTLPSHGRTRAWKITCNIRLTRCSAKAPNVRVRHYGVDKNGKRIEGGEDVTRRGVASVPSAGR